MGTDGGTDEFDAGFLGRAASLAVVAGDAARDDVLPARLPAARARHHVVEVKLGAGEFLPAKLADVSVPQVDIEPRKLDMAARHAIVGRQQDHPGNPDHPIHQPHLFMMRRDGELAPTLEIEGRVLVVDRLRDPLIQEDQSALQGGDVDRKVRTVKNQDVGCKHLQEMIRKNSEAGNRGCRNSESKADVQRYDPTSGSSRIFCCLNWYLFVTLLDNKKELLWNSSM